MAGCISTKNRENAGNAEFKNLDNDWAADTVFGRFFFRFSSSNGDGLLWKRRRSSSIVSVGLGGMGCGLVVGGGEDLVGCWRTEAKVRYWH